MADINFLKAQVDPHTIFNTINTIHGQLAVDVKSGRDNLVKFSELMHYQLYECNDKFVDVEKEIQHLEKYVDLQKLRRSGKIELECYIDPSLKEMFVAPLLFIPLVENAFKYVSNSNSGKYFIKIDLTRKENTIKFRCENSYTKKSEDAQLKRKSGGIGLDNLKKRLNATYNDRYKLVIDKGTEIFKAELEIYVD
ncbi:MAG: histidine kinase [Sphingobacteriaceae bacterium]|nr:histidine kinase [Sphingobacteriaceae bacterium]